MIWAEPGARNDDIDLMMIGSGAVVLDSGKAMFNYDTQSLPPAGYNGANYSNAEFDALLDQSDSETDPAKRDELLCQLQTMLVEDAPSIWMYTPTFPVAMRSDLTGLVEIPLGFLFTSWVQPK